MPLSRQKSAPPTIGGGARATILVLAGALAGCGESAKAPPAQPVTGDEFVQTLVGVPLCGVPKVGPFAGKNLCTVHLPDGTAIVAGSGILARALWSQNGNEICRRDAQEPREREHCVEYQRIDAWRYRNSDGVEFCIGPCS
jgi:hypothetical protein